MPYVESLLFYSFKYSLKVQQKRLNITTYKNPHMIYELFLKILGVFFLAEGKVKSFFFPKTTHNLAPFYYTFYRQILKLWY